MTAFAKALASFTLEDERLISLMNRTAIGPSNFLIGLASIHLVNLSTATSRCAMPPRAVLKGPTMSSPQTTKGQAIGMVRSADVGW